MYRESIIYGCVLIVGIFTLILGIIPAIGNAWNIQNEINGVVKEMGALEKKATTLTALDSTAVTTDFQTVLIALPSTKNVSSIMGSLEKVADAVGIPIVGFSMDTLGQVGTGSAKKRTAEEQKIGVQVLSATVSVEGTIEKIRDYIDAIQKTSRLMRVKNFDLSFSSKNNAMHSKIVIDTYFAEFPKTIGSVSESLVEFTPQDQELLGKFVLLKSPVEEPSRPVEIVAPSASRSANSNPFSPF